MSQESNYTEDKIKSLSALEHIRLRPGMYIGRLGDGSNPNDGIYILLKEIIDNGIDEYVMGYGEKIEIKINELNFSVRDYGRGIPLKKLLDCVSKINTGAKYNTDVFQFSVGLNGVGTKAVNALSKSFTIRSIREGNFKEIRFKEGKLIEEKNGISKEKNGTLVSFSPSSQIFPKEVKVNFDFIKKRLWNYAYLNRGLTLLFNNEKFYSRSGLLDFLNNEVGKEKLYDVIYFRDNKLEIAFTHTKIYGEQYFSFANGQHTIDGGVHLSAFKEGIVKGVNDFCKKNYHGNDIRGGLIASISIKINEPIFESQTKNKLANTEIKIHVVKKTKEFISDFLYKNQDTAIKIQGKIDFNEKIRKDIQILKKNARDKEKKANLKIPKLRDCKHHFNEATSLGEKSQIFLTEGDSATGSMIHCRDTLTQALFALRGKPLNCFNLNRDTVYKNEEFFFIMKALGIEDSIKGLRYNKVIIATDADQDGLHIRNLLITYFLTFFDLLISQGHLYLLETPLFRVRNKKFSFYCYSQEEKNKAIKKLGNSCEITRFKGLGEISPQEFKQFIGNDIRLIPITLEHPSNTPKTLEFFMGKNSPQRKNFIINNLV